VLSLQRTIWLPILLITMSLAVIACQDSGTSLAPLGTQDTNGDKFATSDQLLNDRFGGDIMALRSYLAYLDSLSNKFTYETVLQLPVVVGTAASASASPASWGPGYEFSIDIPADALVGTQYLENEEVTITISVPVGSTVFDDPKMPMPIIMLPHGIDFETKVQMQASHHPNLDGSCEDGYELIYVEQDPAKPQFQIYGGYQQVQGQGPDCRRNIGLAVPHFSKWYLSQGRPDTSSGGGGGDYWD